MLQWMGGSRRKVTTSRKSTQKRQKQYFEQRKRQQQQTAGLEGYSDKTGTCSPHQEKNRSLDILSLLNLSAIGRECNSSCPSARESLESDFSTRNIQDEQYPTTTQMEIMKIFAADPVEFKETRTSSNYEGETECPRKVSFGSSASHTKALNGNSAKLDQFKIATDHNFSVLDLLGDDGQNSNSEGSLVHEAHVAFSVEGLGKVETKTPVHSPRQPGRSFIYGCASPVKPTKRAHSTRHRDCRLDDLEPEVGLATTECDIGLLDSIYEFPNDLMCDDMPFAGSLPELRLFSRGMAESFSDPKQKLTSGKDFLQLNQNSNNRKSFFSDDEIFYNSENQDEYKWKASPSFLDKNFLDEECDLSWKNWPYDLDSTNAGGLNISNWEKAECSFESFCMPERRSGAKAAHRFNISEPSAPYIKHKVSENYHDFIAPERTWCPTVGRTCDVRDVTNQPAWSSFITDDARDSLSLLSEESCSSSAVWREATKKSPHHPKARQKMRVPAGECSSPVANLSQKNEIFPQEYGENRDSPQQQDSINEQGKRSRMSNSSTSKPTHYSTTTSQETAADE